MPRFGSRPARAPATGPRASDHPNPRTCIAMASPIARPAPRLHRVRQTTSRARRATHPPAGAMRRAPTRSSRSTTRFGRISSRRRLWHRQGAQVGGPLISRVAPKHGDHTRAMVDLCRTRSSFVASTAVPPTAFPRRKLRQGCTPFAADANRRSARSLSPLRSRMPRSPPRSNARRCPCSSTHGRHGAAPAG